MTKTSETGFEVNVANLDVIIESVLGIGKDYNPAKAVLAASSLKNASTNCKQANNEVMTAISAYKSAVDDREAGFKELKNRITRVGNSMLVSNLTPGNIATAKEMIRKFQGRRAAKTNDLVKTDVTGQKQISVSQMGFDNRLKNSAQFVNFLSSLGFKPNEPELQTESLMAFIEDLNKKNAAVIAAKSAMTNARIRRNELMYKEGTGLVYIAKDVKSYIKSLFGPRSPQYKKIAGIQFRIKKHSMV